LALCGVAAALKPTKDKPLFITRLKDYREAGTSLGKIKSLGDRESAHPASLRPPVTISVRRME